MCCSAYAKISQTYIDMLGDGKKVRFLQDSNLGPILRMITCVRIKTTEDLKKAFRAFATQSRLAIFNINLDPSQVTLPFAGDNVLLKPYGL